MGIPWLISNRSNGVVSPAVGQPSVVWVSGSCGGGGESQCFATPLTILGAGQQCQGDAAAFSVLSRRSVAERVWFETRVRNGIHCLPNRPHKYDGASMGAYCVACKARGTLDQ
jgi:hypothetical protein